jgi:hypothetical protein
MSTKWITLNDTTIPIDSIESIEMTMEKTEYIFVVQCRNRNVHKVHLYATGGHWLYTICHDGLEEAKRGGERYERL